MTDTTVTANSTDAEQNKVMAILAYIIFFIPIFAAKDSAFARYHANQGTWLAIFGIVGTLVGIILTPFVIGACIVPIVSLAWLVYAILGIVNAAQGKMQSLPGFDALPVLVK